MKIWIVLYSHRYDMEVWPVNVEPDLDELGKGLDDFEPERGEFLESFGPFEIDEATE